jgi:hypothetical protein
LTSFLTGCATNTDKGPLINVQEQTSKQDIIDIVDIVSHRHKLVLGRQLRQIPKINFVTVSELQAHLRKHHQVSTKSQEKGLSHFSHAVAAIYCTHEKSIYVVPQNFNLHEQRNSHSNDRAYYAVLNVLSHELVHALQDQEGLLDWQESSRNRDYAHSIMIEGHTEMQNALILKDMGIIDSIYDFGTHKEPTDVEDTEQAKHDDKFSNKYIIGKKLFNNIHKQYGNEKTWQVLKTPSKYIDSLLKKNKDFT